MGDAPASKVNLLTALSGESKRSSTTEKGGLTKKRCSCRGTVASDGDERGAAPSETAFPPESDPSLLESEMRKSF